MNERPIGLTRDAGWQIGVSRTVHVPIEEAWNFLVSAAGLAIWLGTGVDTPLAKGQCYETTDGTTGEIRSLHKLDRVRLTWKPKDRHHSATTQASVQPTNTGCTIRLHTEKLVDAEDRDRMRAHWQTIAERLNEAMTESAT
jgi:uncharacterized protein YndB with AHSA1/START domain